MVINQIQFSGLVLFAGMDQLPPDTPIDLSEIRKWALSRGLITDPEFQLLIKDRMGALAGHFRADDQLQIALAVHPRDGKPFYFEYPFLPVRSLIRRGEEVELYYWRMMPTRWDLKGNILDFGEVRFGFLVPGCTEEICSLSTAKLIVEKLQSQLLELSDQYRVQDFTDGSREITAEGVLTARFLKNGRYFDVDLTKKR